MFRRSIGLAAAILLLAMVVPAQGTPGEDAGASVDVDVRHLGPDVKAPELRLAQARREVARESRRTSAGAR